MFPDDTMKTNRHMNDSYKTYSSLVSHWTDGLKAEERLISIFTHIRDIPYAIIPEWRNSDDIISLMVTRNKGWCGPKHYLLSWMFEQSGVQVRYRYIVFRWQDQPFDYPDSIRDLFPHLSCSIHLCTEALLHGAWRLVDATWDPGLHRAGFFVNHSWDGRSDTLPAVRVCNETPDLNQEIHEPADIRILFIQRLNEWMERVRKGN